MYYIDCESNAGMVWEVVDETTSAAVSISGTLDGADGCAYSGGFDVANNAIYWADGNYGHIGKYDLDTNSAELIEISGDAADIWQLAISANGTAIMESNGSGPGYGFYSIDLETGVTTTIDDTIGSWGYLAYNPANDSFMHFVRADGDIDVYSINPEDGTQTFLNTLSSTEFPRVTNACGNNDTGASFDQVVIDSNGNYWIQMDGSYSDMVVYNPTTESYSYNGQVHDHEAEIYPADQWCGVSAFYQMGMILTYGNDTADPGLADTGIDGKAVAGLTAVGAVALVAGGFAMRRRRRA